MSTQAEQQQPKAAERKLVASKHKDLHAAAAIYDILDELSEKDRQQVIAWIKERFPEKIPWPAGRVPPADPK